MSRSSRHRFSSDQMSLSDIPPAAVPEPETTQSSWGRTFCTQFSILFRPFNASGLETHPFEWRKQGKRSPVTHVMTQHAIEESHKSSGEYEPSVCDLHPERMKDFGLKLPNSLYSGPLQDALRTKLAHRVTSQSRTTPLRRTVMRSYQ